MNTARFDFEVLTPAFAGGAEPLRRAEIRPASIRGQLRWWFRVLDGFRSQDSPRLRKREAEVFGSAAKDHGVASPLVIRVANAPASAPPKNLEQLGGSANSDKGYLLWPLRGEARASIPQGSLFQLQILWLGREDLWPDIQALITVFAHLGSLGFRGRRAMGALYSATAGSLSEALKRFKRPENIGIRKLQAQSADHAISVLGGWLKSWRAHGRTGQNAKERDMPGYGWAESDHDLVKEPAAPKVYRAALGLPITQSYSRGSKVQWPERFASPVLLRPYKDATGWLALVIFVHNHEMTDGDLIERERSPRITDHVPVSLDLLRAMQADPNLQPFLP